MENNAFERINGKNVDLNKYDLLNRMININPFSTILKELIMEINYLTNCREI